MKKRTVPLIFIVILSVSMSFCACERTRKTDYPELNRRLKKEDAAYGFNEDEMFINGGVYYAFYSVFSEDDMLLTMTEDSEHMLTSVTLTAAGNDKTEGFSAGFLRLAAALTSAFVPPEEAETLVKAVNGYKEVLFSECFDKTQSGRYSAELFSDPVGVSVMISRK